MCKFGLAVHKSALTVNKVRARVSDPSPQIYHLWARHVHRLAALPPPVSLVIAKGYLFWPLLIIAMLNS